MDTVGRMVAAGRLTGYFERAGYSLHEVSDFDEVRSIVSAADKPYLSSFGDPAFNDFTQGNCLWLVVLSGDQPIFMGCSRLEDLSGEHIDAYWRRQFIRHHGENGRFRGVPCQIREQLRGRLVYFGDLFVAKQGRGSREGLRAFLALAHLAVSLKWNPDWTYCFIREQHVLRGAVALYGFTRQFPDPIDWVFEPPAPRTANDWLVALPRKDLMSSVRRVITTMGLSGCEQSEQQE